MLNIILSAILVFNIIALCFFNPKNKAYVAVVAIVNVPIIVIAIVAGVAIIGTVVPEVAYHVVEEMQ